MQRIDFRTTSRGSNLIGYNFGHSLDSTVRAPETSTHVSEDGDIIAGFQSRNVDVDGNDRYEHPPTVCDARKIERR